MSQAKMGKIGDYSTYNYPPMNLPIDIDGHRLSIGRQKLTGQLINVAFYSFYFHLLNPHLPYFPPFLLHVLFCCLCTNIALYCAYLHSLIYYHINTASFLFLSFLYSTLPLPLALISVLFIYGPSIQAT